MKAMAVDTVGIHPTPHNIYITFGNMTPDKVTVIINPQVAIQMAMLLRRQLKIFETEYGQQYPMTEKDFESIKAAPEDWFGK